MYDCFACVYVCTPWACQSVRSSETGVIDACETLCGFWELNLLQKQQMLFTPEPSLQPCQIAMGLAWAT